ncbi:OsmC family protein [bacterium SCSIO 12643]|nr:OsmC family protein [bacterium SCSIO 12643]
MKIELNQKDGLLFEAQNELQNTIQVGVSDNSDAHPIRPMELLLMGVAGCSSVDVIGILNKQRQKIDDYKVVVHGERVKAIPAIFKSIHVEFHLLGDIQPEKAQRAIHLSIDKYCSVSKMLEQATNITTQLYLNNKKYEN